MDWEIIEIEEFELTTDEEMNNTNDMLFDDSDYDMEFGEGFRIKVLKSSFKR